MFLTLHSHSDQHGNISIIWTNGLGNLLRLRCHHSSIVGVRTDIEALAEDVEIDRLLFHDLYHNPGMGGVNGLMLPA